jgi:hypothetical protein
LLFIFSVVGRVFVFDWRFNEEHDYMKTNSLFILSKSQEKESLMKNELKSFIK